MSKLRENNKVVIGVGVKKVTSDLLISNCDEFIFYDDLVRERAKKQSRKKSTAAANGATTVRHGKRPRRRKRSIWWSRRSRRFRRSAAPRINYGARWSNRR